MSTALFGGSGAVRSKNMVEFRAGKMSLKGKMVHADKRKGLAYVYQSEDSLMHFCWKDRTSGVVEDDLMIFPDDIEIKRVSQCTTGRVYLMRFKSSNKKLFFWMQEPESDKDEKLWRRVNDSLNNPPPPGSQSSVSSGGGGAGGSDRLSGAAASLGSAFGADFAGGAGNDLQSLLGSMSEQQLQMFLGGLMPSSVNSPTSAAGAANRSTSSSQASRAQSTLATPSRGGSEPTPQTPAAVSATSTTASGGSQQQSVPTTPLPQQQAQQQSVPSAPVKQQPTAVTSVKSEPEKKKIQLSDLQSILGNIDPTSYGTRQELDLSELISLDVMAPILANPSVQERLTPFLPDADILPKTEHELRTTLTTPQFKKAMSSFGAALQSGQLGPLMQQFQLPESVSVAAAQGDVEAFARAMEEHAAKTATKSPNTNDDDQMDTK